MSSPLDALEPRPVWAHFDAIRRVPRPPRREKLIVEHARGWAAEHGFAVRADARGNLVVAVPASAGREAAPTVVLQAHLDMVCEKNADVEHDFERHPIAVEVDGDWVRARGTTLGADNGLGVAASMAVAVDPEVEHGPLELLWTLDEEIGLLGAGDLDPAIVTGQLLLNLDTEEDDAIYIGCAGAGGHLARLPLERRAAPPAAQPCELRVGGLRGGHSGIDILENRGNAVKIAARILLAAAEAGVDVGLVALSGGAARNALARECVARLASDGAARSALAAVLEEQRAELEEEFGAVEPQMTLALAAADAAVDAWGILEPGCRDRLLRLVSAVPHGVIAMSREVPGLVETSNNLAVVTTGESAAELVCSFRSSVNAALAGTARSLASLFRLAGAEVTEEAGYPGWKPNPASPIVRRTEAVYERLFGAPPAVKAVHAGLECGILAQKVPGLDAVSIGPEIRDPHSPRERVCISSVAKFYTLLGELLGDLAEGSR